MSLLDECAICLENIQPQDTFIHGICQKKFHNACIDTWLKGSIACKKCPSCRQTINEEGGETITNLSRINPNLYSGFSRVDPSLYSEVYSYYCSRDVRSICSRLKTVEEEIKRTWTNFLLEEKTIRETSYMKISDVSNNGEIICTFESICEPVVTQQTEHFIPPSCDNLTITTRTKLIQEDEISIWRDLSVVEVIKMESFSWKTVFIINGAIAKVYQYNTTPVKTFESRIAPPSSYF